MPPQGRKPRDTRMDAAIDAMKPLGFDERVVMVTMRQLLKTYGGEYMFIEQDGYSVLFNSLCPDKEIDQKKNKPDFAPGEVSSSKVIVEGGEVKENHAIVPTDGFIDIAVCSSNTLTILPPPPPPPPSLPPPTPPPPPLSLPPPPPLSLPPLPPPPPLSLPPPPPLSLPLSLPLPPPPPPRSLPPPPPPPPSHPPSPPPPPPPFQDVVLPHPPHVWFDQPRRRKPCYGWLGDDDENEEQMCFITLPSSSNKQISPPRSPPVQPETRHQETKPELTSGITKKGQKRRSRWDIKPEDM